MNRQNRTRNGSKALKKSVIALILFATTDRKRTSHSTAQRTTLFVVIAAKIFRSIINVVTKVLLILPASNTPMNDQCFVLRPVTFSSSRAKACSAEYMLKIRDRVSSGVWNERRYHRVAGGGRVVISRVGESAR